MTKKQFQEKLQSRVKELIEDKDIILFRNFQLVNETPDGMLPRRAVKKKYKLRKKVWDNEAMREKYYLFHCLFNLNRKWRMTGVKSLVNQWYKESSEIRKIYEDEEGEILG